MPTLDTYRKQAKLMQRWHRERDYSIGERVRKLERFRTLTDEQVLARPFTLALAQEIVAVEAGHRTWAELKAATVGGPAASQERDPDSAGAECQSHRRLLPAKARLRDRLPARTSPVLRLGLARRRLPAPGPRGQALFRPSRQAREIVDLRLLRSRQRARPIRGVQNARRRLRSNPNQTSLGRNRFSRPRSRWQRYFVRYVRVKLDTPQRLSPKLCSCPRAVDSCVRAFGTFVVLVLWYMNPGFVLF